MCILLIQFLTTILQSCVLSSWQLPVTDLCTLRTYRCDVSYCLSPMIAVAAFPSRHLSHTPSSHLLPWFPFICNLYFSFLPSKNLLDSYQYDLHIISHYFATLYNWCISRFTDLALLWPDPTPTLILKMKKWKKVRTKTKMKMKMKMKMKKLMEIKMKMKLKHFLTPPCPSEVSVRTTVPHNIVRESCIIVLH